MYFLWQTINKIFHCLRAASAVDSRSGNIGISSAEIFRKRDEEGIAKIEAEEKRWLEERMRQQRERNREIMEEERKRAKRRGAGNERQQ